MILCKTVNRRDALRSFLLSPTLSTLLPTVAPGIGLAESSTWPFNPPARRVLVSSRKRVYAHYFAPFPISLDNKDPSQDYYAANYLNPAGENGKFAKSGGYLRERPLPQSPLKEADWKLENLKLEVERASALGINGFMCDLLSTDPKWLQSVYTLLSAAKSAGADFKISLMPDMFSLGNDASKLGPVVDEFASDPAVEKMSDGRLLITPYGANAQSAAWWEQWILNRAAKGHRVALFPVVQGWLKYVDAFKAISVGISDWGDREPNEKWKSAPAQAHKQGLLWMMPVAPQDMRPKNLSFWESQGSTEFRTQWRNAIQGDADWVQVITWNDYSESTEIAPSTGIQWSFYDLSAYYITWFKTGEQPPIVRDVLYYFHRIQAVNATFGGQFQATRYTKMGGTPAADNVELLAFLVKPGTLEISLGESKVKQAVPAGISSVKVPLQPGTPRFKLIRYGKTEIDFESAFAIGEKLAFPDLLYRGGSSSRPPVNS